MLKIDHQTTAFLISALIGILLIASCKTRSSQTPKPKGYHRIDFPKKTYTQFESGCSYTFEYPEYSEIISDPENTGNDCWLNVYYPDFEGNIHISYKEINGNLDTFTEDSRTLVYKHTVKAESIQEQSYESSERKVYGILYKLEGNVASPMQFFVTDSTEHFIRGSLYFNTEPNKDSLAPVIEFVQKDIRHLIETLEWKNK
ncbi:MAG: gliding motility lipoprotein GldD [Bacteroidales bacterium]